MYEEKHRKARSHLTADDWNPLARMGLLEDELDSFNPGAVYAF
jgi:hypothetical protein